MNLSICEAKIMNSVGNLFSNFLKIRFFLKSSNLKNILNDFEMENLWKLVFRHIKLKHLTKASISCLSHPSMSITTLFMKCFRNCVFANKIRDGRVF
jgi:hypothetical protein